MTKNKMIQMARHSIDKGEIVIDIWYPDRTHERVKYDVPIIIYLEATTNPKYLQNYNTKLSEFADMDGNRLYEIEFTGFYNWQKAIRWFQTARIPIIYATNYVWEYMYAHKLICNDYLKKNLSLDIEVDPNGLDLKNPSYEQPIVAIALEGNDGRKFNFDVPVSPELKVNPDDERALLKKTYAVCLSYWCLMGWNIKLFDLIYIKERTTRLNLNLDWDQFIIFDLMDKYEEFLKRDRKPGEITNKKLDSAGLRMLGEGKEGFNIHKMMEFLRDDPELVRKYVKRDAEMVNRLYGVKGIGSLCEVDVAISKLLYTFPTKMYPTYLFELYLDIKARGRKIKLPNKWEHYQEKVAKKGIGGLVLEPVRGLHKNVISMDFKSLYPNIMRTHNIGINNGVFSKKKADNIINTMGMGFKKDVKGLTAEVMDELIMTRYKYRDKLDDPNLTDAEEKWYGVVSDSYKTLLVSANGIFDNKYFKFRNQPMYNATTKTGQWYLNAPRKILEKMGYKVLYGDSVMPNTPIVIRRNGLVEIVPIEDLHWAKSDARKTRELKRDIEIWTDIGWSKIKYSFRHEVKKRGYRILTDKGYVETTDDHSLIIDGKEISPKDLKAGDKIERYRPILDNSINFNEHLAWVFGLYTAEGTRGIYNYGKGKKKISWRIANQDVSLLEKAKKYLLENGFLTKIIYSNKDNMKYLIPVGKHHRILEYFDICHSKRNDEKIVPSFILNANVEAQQAFYDGYFVGDGHLSNIGIEAFVSIDYSLLEGLTFILDNLGKDYYLSRRKDKLNTVRVRVRKGQPRKRKPLEIISIEEFDIDGPVYDIETENHHFCGGLGGILLHNTDSLLFEAPYGDDHKRNVASIPFLEDELNRRIKNAAVKKFNLDPNKYYIDFRAEKIYSKIFFSEKKNYVGRYIWKEYKWIDPMSEKAVDAKGIVMMKYNTIPIVKETMMEIFKILLSKIDDEKELKRQFIRYLQKLRADLYAHQRDELLMISQRVDKMTGYKSEPPHIKAAKKLDKLGLFEPGMNVEYIRDESGEIFLYGVEDFTVSRRTYDRSWRMQVGKWVDKILGREISSHSSLDFGYSKPAQSLI